MAVELTVQEAEQLRSNCKKQIELQESLIRLMNNSDFKKVFLENYTKEEPSRIVALLAESSFNMVEPNRKKMYREDLEERLIGIARFSEYLRQISSIAEKAKATLDELATATLTE